MKHGWRLAGIGLSALLLGAGLYGQAMPVMAEEDETMCYAAETDVPLQIAEADNALGKELMAKLVEKGENVFISPYSIATALSLLGHCSEEGEQIEEIRALLGYEEFSEEEILEGQQQLMNELRLDYGMEDYTKEELELFGVGTVEFGNAVYVDDEVSLLPAFDELDELLAGYQAEIAVKALETEDAKDEINAWVKEKTHELIDSILDEPLPEDMAMLLMNTVYFKSGWAKTFSEEATDEQVFYGADGENEVSMMHQQSRFAYMETDEYQVIRLPYQHAYEMRIYLPKDAETYKKWSDAEYLTELGTMEMPTEYREVSLSMPKFELEYSTELKDVLTELGVTKIFDGWSYDRISEEPLGVGSILHKTALKNDEEGTEAAAVTAIMVATMALVEPETPVEMTIDKPFYFTITHTELGLNLFEGCVLNLGE